MSRETRRVPANWDHPTNETGAFIPLIDQDFDEAVAAYEAGRALWEQDLHPAQASAPGAPYEAVFAAPRRANYRPYIDDETSWYQFYECVTEGTPLTPAFRSADQLAAYLADYGTFWDQEAGRPGWGEDRARAMVMAGTAPPPRWIGDRLVRSDHLPGGRVFA